MVPWQFRSSKNKPPLFGGIGLCLLALLLVGCSGLISDNPVEKALNDGVSTVSITPDPLDPLYDAHDVSTNSSGDVSQEQLDLHQKTLDEFIGRIKSTDQISYQRTISFDNAPPESKDSVVRFLRTSSLQMLEENGRFLATDPATGQRLLHTETETQLINYQLAINDPLIYPEDASKELLYTLTQEIPLTLLSVEQHQAGDQTTYTALVINENGRTARWFFSDQGNLFLRLFFVGDVQCGIRYDYLNLAPIVTDTTFTLEGAMAVPTDPAASSQPESSQEESSTASREPTASSSSPPPPPASSQPPASLAPSTSPPPASTAPPSQTASSEAVSSTNEHYVPDYSKDAVKIPPKVVEPPKKPAIPDNYPRSQVPLMPGFTVISSSDTLDGYQRTIHLKGGITGTFEGATSYYTNLLENSGGFTSKEMYDEQGGYTYRILAGSTENWSVSVEIAESHANLSVTLSLRLDSKLPASTS